MIVTAKVIAEAWDSKTAQYFYPNTTVVGFDTESELGRRLAGLKTPLGRYVFQWEGHEVAPPEEAAKDARIPVKPKKVMSAEDRKAVAARMLAGRQRRRRRLAEAAEEEVANDPTAA